MDLYEACENGNEERVVELLVFGQETASQLRARGLAGRTALLMACMGGQASVVRLLLGEKCVVHFTISMVTKDGDVVPMAQVQLPCPWTIPPSELLEGKRHVDDFGNTPLQCVSCFGCGSTVKHITDGLEITRQLLLHGDQPNLPKRSNKWTPLHWGAYNGNHEQIRMLLDPVKHVGDGTQRFAKTQYAIPLLIDSDDLFPVDIAGRRGLALRDDRSSLLGDEEYVQWRLRLDHVKVVQLLIHEFLSNGAHLTRYVAEMNARNPLQLQKSKASRVTVQDAVRYGQHLLYWAGCFGLEDDVRSLLQLELTMSTMYGGNTGKAVVQPLTDEKDLKISLRMLYTCSCEAGKRQSVLHAVAGHGQVDVLKLFLEKMLDDQLHPSDAATLVGSSMTSSLLKGAKPKKNLVVPTTKDVGMSPESTETEKPELLSTIEMADAGWKNYRNETPLFNAVLYLQDQSVQLLATMLCPQSLAWEFQNVNVEGSSLHHVSSETSRRVLGELHRSFAPSLVVTRSGVRKITSLAQGETDYLVVGVADEVLIQQAQVLQLKVKHRGSSTRSKYNASFPDLFESFRSLQRQQVILSIIQRKINLQKHLKNGNIKAIFPLHDAMGCRNIIRHWGSTDSYERIFQPFAGNSMEQFFLERKSHQYEMLWPLLTYFGEKHAFYYAFVTFYTVWLLPIALIGVACQFLWLIDDISFVSPLFAIVVSIWATLVVERWKRKRSEIQRKFGHFRRNRSEETPGFYGDFQVETSLLRAKTVVDVSFPRALQLARIYAGLPLLMTMGVSVVVVFVAVKTNTASAVVVNAIPWLPVLLVPYVVPLLNAISMLLLDNWYTRLARALTTWENHRTVWEFESNLATKLFWFKFLNAFISLFWIAFIDQNAAALRKQLVMIMGIRQLWNSIKRDVVPMFHVRYRWRSAGFRFRSVSTSHFWSLATHEWYNAEITIESQERHPPPPTVLIQELMYPHDFLMGKQMEVVLQFGYVTMFVSVLPAAPVFALLSNVVAMRLDVLSCTQAKRRPPFESETEVSTFLNILEFMSFAAMAVNCAVLFFTTRPEFESLIKVTSLSWNEVDSTTSYVTELWVLLGIEHVVLGAKALLSLVIDDSASWVRLDEDQTDEEEKRRMLGRNSLSNASTARCSTTVHEDQQRNSREPSKFNQVLAKQYLTALQERDEALKREQTALQLLTESMKQNPIATNKGKAAEKRCLSCRIALCQLCDGILHLDDLGVKEPSHFRVKIPEGLSSVHDLDNCTGMEPIDVTSKRRCSKHEKKVLKELQRRVESFTIQLQLSSDEAFQRCCVNVRIALRYLRNHERHLESSNPAVSPAFAPASTDPKEP
eukprot:jgi/Phyca11/530368/estExt2_fgenesh1_pm.C_PHYCAscaffold_620027